VSYFTHLFNVFTTTKTSVDRCGQINVISCLCMSMTANPVWIFCLRLTQGLPVKQSSKLVVVSLRRVRQDVAVLQVCVVRCY